MTTTKATELAQLSRKLTCNEGTDVAAIDGDGDFITTGDNTDSLEVQMPQTKDNKKG